MDAPVDEVAATHIEAGFWDPDEPRNGTHSVVATVFPADVVLDWHAFLERSGVLGDFLGIISPVSSSLLDGRIGGADLSPEEAVEQSEKKRHARVEQVFLLEVGHGLPLDDQWVELLLALDDRASAAERHESVHSFTSIYVWYGGYHLPHPRYKLQRATHLLINKV